MSCPGFARFLVAVAGVLVLAGCARKAEPGREIYALRWGAGPALWASCRLDGTGQELWWVDPPNGRRARLLGAFDGHWVEPSPTWGGALVGTASPELSYVPTPTIDDLPYLLVGPGWPAQWPREWVGAPCWSPDGTHMAWARGEREKARVEVWTWPGLRQEWQCRLEPHVYLEWLEPPALSNGGEVAVAGGNDQLPGQQDLFVVTANGVRRITRFGDVAIRRDPVPRWSHDGGLLFARSSSPGTLWRAQASGAAPKVVRSVVLPGSSVGRLVWDSAGSSLAGWVKQQEDGEWVLAVFPPTRSGPRIIPGATPATIQWSPDGNWLALVRNHCEIWLASSDGRELKQVSKGLRGG